MVDRKRRFLLSYWSIALTIYYGISIVKFLSNKIINNDNIVNIPNYNNKTIDWTKTKPKDDFSRYIFALINSLRLNPPSYIDTILRAKNNITKDKSGLKIYKS